MWIWRYHCRCFYHPPLLTQSPPPPSHTPIYIIQTISRCSSVNVQKQTPDDSQATSWEQQPHTRLLLLTHVMVIMDVIHIHEKIRRSERNLLLLQFTLPIERLQSITPFWQENKAHFFRKVKGKKNTQRKNFYRTDWKYARLESTAILPDSRSKAPAGSFRKGMIAPATDPSGNGFKLCKLSPELCLHTTFNITQHYI